MYLLFFQIILSKATYIQGIVIQFWVSWKWTHDLDCEHYDLPVELQGNK